ncbi:CPBP family intramembrane glutamic endopeptidase [Lacticaseibacillus paracasei]|uniref:CPBP family intramembrane glutamic endopeptidase n=1 Tax=Lacticaseibacillus paracasei TaxID=1597 RepID=UPI003865A01B
MIYFMKKYIRRFVNVRKVKKFLLPFFIAFGWFIMTLLPMLVILLFNRNFDFNSTLGNLLALWTNLFGLILIIIHYKGDTYYLPFAKKRMLQHYGKGFLFGSLFFAITWLFIFALRGFSVHFVFAFSGIPVLCLFLVGFIFQSMFEELVCRGYIMGYWLKRQKLLTACLANTIFFTLMHGSNAGFNVSAFLGIFLFGIFMSEIRLITGSIWFCGAFHAAWNFAEGNLFGVSVSGSSDLGMVLTSTNTGLSPFITGGAFGVEASWLTIGLYLALGFWVLSRLQKQKGKLYGTTVADF